MKGFQSAPQRCNRRFQGRQGKQAIASIPRDPEDGLFFDRQREEHIAFAHQVHETARGKATWPRIWATSCKG